MTDTRCAAPMVRRQDLPHVTDILKDAGLVDVAFMTEFGRDRGTAVHLATAFDDQGDLDAETVDPAVLLRLEAYRKFRAEVRPEILAIEEAVEYHGSYCGRVDRRWRINGVEGIGDLKGGAPAPWHRLQTQLYALCYDRPLKRWGLYLNEDGYKLVEHNGRGDKAAALAAATIAAFRREHGLI